MDRSALEYLVEEIGATEIINVDDRPYSNRRLFEVKRPEPATMLVSSLSALVDYVMEDLDNLGTDRRLIVHVASPTRVLVWSQLFGEFSQRVSFLEASTDDLLPELFFDRPIDTEQFQIMLRTGFLDSPDRTLLIKYSGNVVDGSEIHVKDDGFTQETTVKAGAASLAKVQVPSPVKLIPYRTFLEVPQVESEFILRLESGPSFRLVEADGGAWRLKAMHRVRAYLRQALESATWVTVIS